MHLSRALTAWAVVAVLVALAGCAAAAGDAATATRAESALLRERFTAGRLARQSAWGPCVLVDSVALVPRSSCARVPKPGTRQFDEISALAVNVARRRTSGASARTLHTAALVDLLWREETLAGVDRAVASLERAAALAPGAAAVLNDLAVARLALAERDQQLRPLLQALDAIERARMLDDTLAPVLFNRALILERLYLVASARRAWARYLVVERDSAWRREATTHARRLAPSRDSALAALGPDELLARGDGPMPAGFHDLVRRAPQSARETGFAVLGEWGRAVGGGDTSRARLALDVAREIANALDAAGADRSFALAVRAIDAPGGGARRRALAGAHADFVDGYALFNRAAYDDAARAFERAERVLRTLGSPASRWVAVYRAAAALNRGDYAAGDAILRRATADATPAEPALLGKATWGLGLSQVRRGAYEAANSYYREAAPHFVRA
ncbi:MAG TPA: hypothetical protein VKA84_24070, partial [Gemmatimonadaceae bacterium]|nr:hypothetical protein [Gemmatimonadaceae bacterium]